MRERTPGDGSEAVDSDLYACDLDPDAVFLATGAEITPLSPVLEQYAVEGSGDTHLAFGERDREDVIFRESLDQLRAEHGIRRPRPLRTGRGGGRAHGPHPGPAPGRVGGVEETDFYVCGLPDVVVDTADPFGSEGVDEEHVYTEGWGADAAED